MPLDQGSSHLHRLNTWNPSKPYLEVPKSPGTEAVEQVVPDITGQEDLVEALHWLLLLRLAAAPLGCTSEPPPNRAFD